MLLFLVQEAILEAAGMVAKRQFSQAVELLTCVVSTVSSPPTSSSSQKDPVTEIPLEDFAIVPISEQCTIACPDWDDEFFHCPFTFYVRGGSPSTSAETTAESSKLCLAIALFNLGLCFHLDGMRKGPKTAAALQNACTLYGHAWNTLQSLGDSDSYAPNDITFLRMALCVNLAQCCYHVGALDATNQWMTALRRLLQDLLVDADSALALELHNFFLMASAVHTGVVAAGAA